ncbi:penicillin-binding transpeptidase domain-containing protein [Flavobacterium sp. TR2]|uniref:penicillin-binding transpeptidase domain-containing protein n=1 Tax=Flavobacterium sp. TR2 TaxID=2977321 RepID=UPI0021B0F8D5|nr:penicillin-binding transpeptidase domain-containing protein [Flavobacterium sp. TR2]UWY27133.1 penicillin-binding transpeptidase domain-containing protein [Flavobacterium sp. TR2]
MTYKVFLSLTSAILISCLSKGTNKNSVLLNAKDTVIVRQDFKKYFDSCGVTGSIAIYDNVNHKWILSDKDADNAQTLPASTFKIVNLLIALETKTISSENDIVKWVGKTDTVRYGYRPEIYHDMTVKEAFKVSAGWVFVELAKKIGKKNYEKYLQLCNYGNVNLSQKDSDFWNFGDFGISPINQVEFLKKLYDEKLPFSRRNIQIVKNVMLSDEGSDYKVYSKTGWTREKGVNIGWWVGYIEKESRSYFFATRLLQDRKNNRSDFGSCRKDITKAVFKELQICNF